MAAIEIFDNYIDIGIQSRPITLGQEFDMVKEFIDYRKESFKETSTNQLAVFLETKINGSYPDIIFAEYNPTTYKSWCKARNIININDMKVLHYIFTNKRVTSQEIVSDLSVKYKDLLFSIERLYDSELIDRVDQAWVRVEKNIFGISKIEAVEAKINKWDQVMQQAIVNKSFASESSILSKRKGNPNVNIFNRMCSFGLGIYLYDENAFSKVASAEKTKLPNDYNSIFINECIGRVLNHI